MKTASRFLTLVSIGLFAAASASAQLADEFRMWTNTAGKQVEATLVSVDAVAKSLKIKTKDGREFDVPIASLSPADFEYAKARYAAMQAAPATPAAATAPAAPAAKPGAPAAKVAAVKKPAPPRPAITILPAAKFKGPSANDYLSGIAKVRPRLIQNAAGWAALKAQAGVDPVFGKLLANIKASGEDLLNTPELTRIFGEQRSDVTPGSKAMYRMAQLAVLNYADGDLKWKDRGVKEVLALCDPATFGDWYPAEPPVTADFVIAVSLGYDWFRDGFNAQQATAVRTHLFQKGIDALAAFLDGEEMPDTAKAKAPGASDSAKAKAKPPAKKPAAKGAEEEEEPGREHMACASALIVAAICLVDEEPAAAKKAAEAAAKVFGKGIVRFAPTGIWPEGLEAGDIVLDYVAMVSQSLKSAAGRDFGLSLLEGIPQAGTARMHMKGPTSLLFNFGDTSQRPKMRDWVSTWLCGQHGNPGIPAVSAGAKQGVESAFFGLAGHFMYYNPHAAGDGTAESSDFALPGGIVAALRSGWTKDDLFIALKGGTNKDMHAQLDLGSFVLDAGGQRWANELGGETERAPGFEVKPGADRTKRYELYLEGTAGQNTLTFEGNQELDAKASMLLGASTPEKGIAVVDLSKAYSKQAKDVHRGAMIIRGAKPYIVLQDDLVMKNSGTLTWTMHTMAEIAPSGATAKLTLGGKTLVATIVSPTGASFTTGTPPEAASEAARDLVKEKVNILKVAVADVKGPQSLCITFALDEAPTHTATPVATWVKK